MSTSNNNSNPTSPAVLDLQNDEQCPISPTAKSLRFISDTLYREIIDNNLTNEELNGPVSVYFQTLKKDLSPNQYKEILARFDIWDDSLQKFTTPNPKIGLISILESILNLTGNFKIFGK